MYRGWTQTTKKKTLQHKPKVATPCTEDGYKHTTKQTVQYKPKVATTCTEDGHKQTTKTSTKI